MTMELAELRGAVADAIAEKVPEPPEVKRNERLIELQRRLRSISPEVVAGKPEALAELAEIESEIAEAERAQRLADLAAEEEASRTRIAAEQEAARKRAEWEKQRAEFDVKRTASLKKAERAITGLVNAIAELGDIELALRKLGANLDPDYHAPNWLAPVEDRLSIKLRELGIKWIDLPYAGRGRTALGTSEK